MATRKTSKTKKKTTRKTAKKKAVKPGDKIRLADLTDAQLSKMYEEHGFNAASIARTLGVSRQIVGRRLRKAGISNERTKAAGQAAGVLTVITNQGNQGFRDGMYGSLREMGLLHRLDAALDEIEVMQAALKAEVQKQDGRYKPYQLDQMLKLIREIRGLTESTFAIKAKLYETAAVDSFMRSVVEVLKEEIPDVQRRLYVKLSNLGLEEQVAGDGQTGNTSH